MPRLYALADLHLSETGQKPMDVFGPLWDNHAARMAEAWDRTVSAGDLVLLPGDLSWARNAEEAEPDLRWIHERPGSKLLLRGNHDSWWGSRSKVMRQLPSSCRILLNDAQEWENWVIVGARGWTAPNDPIATEADAKIFERELTRLDASIADADRRFERDRPRLAMTHYPPWLRGRGPTSVIARLRSARVLHCLYGHLHGDDHELALHGIHEGIHFHFVAADAIDFTPVEILTRS